MLLQHCINHVADVNARPYKGESRSYLKYEVRGAKCLRPRGPASSQALWRECSRCLSSKKAPQWLCQAITSVICGHGMGAKNARCNILHMSWTLFQLATDFGAVFWELSLFSVPILSHFCESSHGSLSAGLGVLWNCSWVQGGLRTCSARCSCRPCWEPHFPWCLHSQNFPFIPVSVSQLQLSAMLFRACNNVLKSDKCSYCGESKPLLEIN